MWRPLLVRQLGGAPATTDKQEVGRKKVGEKNLLTRVGQKKVGDKNWLTRVGQKKVGEKNWQKYRGGQKKVGEIPSYLSQYHDVLFPLVAL